MTIISKPATKNYRKNWEIIFGKTKKWKMSPRNEVHIANIVGFKIKKRKKI